jgi:succinyl-diaminopimelate desuccinylase
LMLNGHLDTVPAGLMADAFRPRVTDGVVWGRGTCDMKGAIAAMAHALIAMSDVSHRSGDLLFTGTVGEETGSPGVKALVDAGIRTTYAVVGEPTSLRIGIAHKGARFFRITLVGRGAHGSKPEEGVNAVSYGSRIVRSLEEGFRARLALRSHPHLGTATVSVGRMCGGTQPNIVAESCTIDIDRRTLPKEPDALAEIEALVSGICDGVAGLSWSIEELPETSEVPHVPLGTQPDGVLVKETQRACLDLGLEEKPIGVPYWTDGGYLSASGIETIILGPGNIAHAHGPQERVPISELCVAADLYFELSRRVLSPS